MAAASSPSSSTRYDRSSPTPTWVPVVIASGSAVGLTFAGFAFYRRFLYRVKNHDYLTPTYLNGKRALKGKVTSVGDADNFRIWHTPIASMAKVPTKKSELKDNTIHIRLAGIDAPELAHFGNPAQPYSAEALDWLTGAVLGKTVVVRPYSKDRYGRVVGMAYVRRFPRFRRSNVSEEMLKQGLATVYTQGGAVHGGLLARFQALEAEAKRRKVGMWAQKSADYESPAQYKARTRSSE